MVQGEEAVATTDGKMGEAEGGRGQQQARQRSTSGGRGCPRTTAPMTPSRWGTHCTTLLGARTIRPGGPQGEERTTIKVGASGRQSGGGGGVRLPSTVEMTRRTPHPLRRCCCCRCCCCHPPSQRRTSREGCRRLPAPTSTPSPLTRRTLSTQTTTGSWWQR